MPVAHGVRLPRSAIARVPRSCQPGIAAKSPLPEPLVPGRSAAAVAGDEKPRPPRLLAQGGWPNRAVCYAAYALMLVAVLGGFDFVHTYGVNLLWADDWDRMPILSDYSAEP